MSENFELETYLCITPTKFGIYLLNTKKLKNLYHKEIVFEETNLINYSNLKNFLDENIYKIEKLVGKFIDNIFLLIENEKILNIKIGVKHKNYNTLIQKEYLQSSITNAKDLFNENYPKEQIIHIIINKYLIDHKSYSYIKENFEYNQLNLVIQFICISKDITKNLNKVLQNYQINITKYLDGNYIKNFFEEESEISKMAFKILNGCNENEVMIVPKNTKKLGFFEKFFQLFS
tara:strand:+ start:1390 stop:2088 length:699 start_codon:yes stop_codon:yes gene_type:complete